MRELFIIIILLLTFLGYYSLFHEWKKSDEDSMTKKQNKSDRTSSYKDDEYLNPDAKTAKMEGLTLEEIRWIDDKIIFLISNLGYIRPKYKFLFNPERNFYNSLSSVRELDTETFNKFTRKNYPGMFRALKMMTEHIGIKKLPILRGVKTKGNKIAKLSHQNLALPYLEVDFDRVDDEYRFAAVLAHELSHYYLHNNKIIKKENLENEKITDICSVYLGFGKVMLNGYLPSIQREKNISKKKFLGYVDIEKMAQVMARLCLFYNIPFGQTRDNLKNDSYSKLSISYKKVKKWNNKFSFTFENRSQYERIIMLCSYCGQKLRFPAKKKDLLISCPSCNKKVELYADIYIGFNEDYLTIEAPIIE